MLGKSHVGRGRPIDRFGRRLGDNWSIKATEGLKLFPLEETEEVCSSGLWLNGGGPGRSARSADLSAVIVNHERVI